MLDDNLKIKTDEYFAQWKQEYIGQWNIDVDNQFCKTLSYEQHDTTKTKVYHGVRLIVDGVELPGIKEVSRKIQEPAYVFNFDINQKYTLKQRVEEVVEYTITYKGMDDIVRTLTIDGKKHTIEIIPLEEV